MTDDGWIFDRLAPRDGWEPDWADVLERAGAVPAATRTKLALAFAAAAIAAIPFVALAASNDWWFLNFGGAPKPAGSPVVVREGEWQGHGWQLVAYPSTTDGLCFGIAAREPGGVEGDTLSCAPFVSVRRTPETKSSPDMTITYVAAEGSPRLPSYILGPVVGAATEVEIRLRDGRSLRTPTFTAPASVGEVRFYATLLPPHAIRKPGERPPFFGFLRWIAGYDANGRIVACLAPATAKDGISPLGDCR